MRFRLLIAVDVALVALATFLADVLRNNFDVNGEHLVLFAPYLMTTVIVAVAVVATAGLHRQIWRFSVMADYIHIANTSVVIVVCAVVAMFSYNRLEGVARALPIIQAVFIAAALVGARVLYRLYRAGRTGGAPLDVVAPVKGESNVLIVGLNPVTELFVHCARSYASKRIAMCGIIAEQSQGQSGRMACGLPVLGDIDRLPEVLEDLNVHGVGVQRIVVTADIDQLTDAQRSSLATVARSGGITVEYFADRLDFVDRRLAGKTDTASPVTKTASPANVTRAISPALDDLEVAAMASIWSIKRAIDIALSSCLLVVTAVPMLLIGLAVMLVMGPPAIFWQNRPGYRGARIKVYKFRSMHAAHDWQGRRVADEKRWSTLGSILRATRLDELPQLFNVWRGDMSFIGPRPLLLAEQGSYPAARLLVRPGLTGWRRSTAAATCLLRIS